MSVTIRTERGNVRVVYPECKHRPCLHIHWSRFASETKYPKDGSKVEKFPLVCIRNEEHGCPHPLPELVKPARAAA